MTAYCQDTCSVDPQLSSKAPDGANYCLGPAGLCPAEVRSFISIHQVAPATATASANARMFHCCSPGVAVMNSIIPHAQLNDLDLDLD